MYLFICSRSLHTAPRSLLREREAYSYFLTWRMRDEHDGVMSFQASQCSSLGPSEAHIGSELAAVSARDKTADWEPSSPAINESAVRVKLVLELL
jgi:hypothetical protein